MSGSDENGVDFSDLRAAFDNLRRARLEIHAGRSHVAKVIEARSHCEVCGASSREGKRYCKEHIGQSNYIADLMKRVDSLYATGYDDIFGKDVKKVPEYFHLLMEGAAVPEDIETKIQVERCDFAPNGFDINTDKYVEKIRSRGRKSKNVGGVNRRGAASSRPKQILIDSNAPAYLILDAA